jgi:hypothetical protein
MVALPSNTFQEQRGFYNDMDQTCVPSMSALPQKVMSALPPKADIGFLFVSTRPNFRN